MDTHREVIKLIAIIVVTAALFMLPSFISVPIAWVLGFLIGVEAQKRRIKQQ